MTHDEYLKTRARLREERPELLDLGELNLYRALALPRLEPSTHAEAPYRCHLAERFLAHLGLPAEWKPRAAITHGVRRSLAALFRFFATKGQRVAVPSDVYPVYLQLAADSGVSFTPWSSEQGLPLGDSAVDAVLICEPKKPWGTSLSEAETAALISWSREGRRMVIIDSAYATPPTSAALRLINEGRALLLCSLSKGWLTPDHGGLCLGSEDVASEVRDAFRALEKDETKLRIAYGALTTHADRPRVVGGHLQAAAEQLDALRRSRPELQLAPCVGYFAVSALPFAALLEHGVLGVPAAVFGSTRAVSIVTSLGYLPSENALGG